MKIEEKFELDKDNPKFVIFEGKQWMPIKAEDKVDKNDRSIEEQLDMIDKAISGKHNELSNVNRLLEPVVLDERMKLLMETMKKAQLYEEQNRLSDAVKENLKANKEMLEEDIKVLKKRMHELRVFVKGISL